MRFVAARGSLFIEHQFFLYLIEHGLAHECWNVRDERPRLGWGGVLGRVPLSGLQKVLSHISWGI